MEGMFYGYKVFASQLMTVTHVRRVKGGYMNRWWIRELVTEPRNDMIVMEQAECIVAHPVVVDRLLRLYGRLNATET